MAILVLVAEGAGHFRDLLCRVLDDDDRFSVVGTAGTGDEALDFADPFDLALVDVALPGAGSFFAIAGLCGRTPPPVVVVLSDNPAIYLRHAAAVQGAAAFLVIPDDLDHLGDELAMRSRSGQDDLVAARPGDATPPLLG